MAATSLDRSLHVSSSGHSLGYVANSIHDPQSTPFQFHFLLRLLLLETTAQRSGRLYCRIGSGEFMPSPIVLKGP